MRRAVLGYLVTTAALGGGLARGLSPAAGLALPPDPQRPFDARTCEEAMARYREAQAGSPLISDEENAEVLARARVQVYRLCGRDAEIGPLKKTQDCPQGDSISPI